MPAPLRPMKAASATELPCDSGQWSYEVKWDGMRVLVEIDGGTVSAWSANGTDATTRFPELQVLGEALAGHGRVVLDGEVIAPDPTTGRPDFGRLQPRMQAASAASVARVSAETPVSYVVFDLLELDGVALLAQPQRRRRDLLEALLPAGPGWFVAAAHDDGRALLDAVEAQGLEGVIAKRRDSRYEPGRRSPAWVKVKVRLHQELVVGGWLPGAGARSATFGALLVGYHDPPAADGVPAGPLRYAGRVGTGFREVVLRDLRERLDRLAVDDSPFDPVPPREVSRIARWVEPRLVVEAAHAEWTADGVLRHPSFLGERIDKDPDEVGGSPDPMTARTGHGSSGSSPARREREADPVPPADAPLDDGDHVVLRVPADPRYARVVRIAASAHAVRLGLAPASVEDLRLAVDEALILLLGAGVTAEPGTDALVGTDVTDEEPEGQIVVTLDATADRPPVTVDLRLEPGPSAVVHDPAALRRFEELIPAGVTVDLVDPAAGRVSLRHAG